VTPWPVVTLADVASPSKRAIISGPFGSNIGKRYFVDTGVPVIRGNNLADRDSKFRDSGFVFLTDEKAAALNCWALPDDLIFTAAGSLGQVGLIPRNGRFPRYVISNKQLRIRLDNRKILPGFAYYYFSAPSMRAYVAGQNKGSSVPLITLGVLRSLPICQPPLPTQRKIASILSAYDDLIESNNRRIKLLEEMAQRIYREWFVEFRYPGHEDVPLVGSEVGLIPKGWTWESLSRLAAVVMGQSPPSSAYNRDKRGLPFHQGVGSYGLHYPAHDVYSTAGQRLAEDGDILVSVRAPVGRLNIADRRLILGRGLSGIRGEGVPQMFLLHALKQYFREEDVIGNGAIFKSVTRRDVEGLVLEWPGEALARRFSEMVEPAWRVLRILTVEVNTLRATRDLLLPRMISGEVDVAGLDIAVPEPAA
jgi:type I restriction enzyme, S subunit